MATMIDSCSTEYAGEKFVYECIEKNLPDDIICYFNREVNAREFDFCLLIKDVGILLIEVKGWQTGDVVRIPSPDKIYLKGESKPVGSPKKQVRGYRFAVLNCIEANYHIKPLVMDMVCYPFMSKKDYKSNGLYTVSEPACTLFKEDISDMSAFLAKIAEYYESFQSLSYASMNDTLFNICRSHFEADFKSNAVISTDSPYSLLHIFPDGITLLEIDEIVNTYFAGTKQIVFVNNEESLQGLAKNLNEKFNSKKIRSNGNNLFRDNNVNNHISVTENRLSVFAFDAYAVENITEITKEKVIIENGNYSDYQGDLLEQLGKASSFNFNQFKVEHAPCDKHIHVKAGAGTGKTFSMISRISFICNTSSGSGVLNPADEIAMLTFTSDAATNMKTRLKRQFMNYFLLTADKKYLDLIVGIERMRISTIHSFATEVVKNSAAVLGIGTDFATVSGNYRRKKIFDQLFNEYLYEANKEDTQFFFDLPIKIYDLKDYLLRFSELLYNKGFDIKTATDDVFGKEIIEMPYLINLIKQVVVKTEIKFAEYLYENNSISLQQYMLYLQKCISDESFNTNLYKFKFMFIDEFQDVDDSQIAAFLAMQNKIVFKFFIVGDLKQSIYRFRGATMDAFTRMGCNEDDWNAYSLNINYRSDKRLLSCYDTLFLQMGKEKLIPYSGSIDSINGIKFSLEDKLPLVEKFEYNPKEEDEQLYSKMFEIILKRKGELEEFSKFKNLTTAEKTIAILTRTNFQIDNIIKAARKYEDISIECNSNGDLYRIQPSIDLCKLTSALSNPTNISYLFDLINSNNTSINFEFKNVYGLQESEKLKVLTNCLDAYYNTTLDMNWAEVVYAVQNKPLLKTLRELNKATMPWKQYSDNYGKQVNYRANYDLVFEDLSEINKRGFISLESINEYLHICIETGTEQKSRDTTVQDDGVHIICTTVHKSKGLEYDTVILPYTDKAIDVPQKAGIEVNYFNGHVGFRLSEGNFSVQNEFFDLDYEIQETEMEEARILYVALTRAINKFSWFKPIITKNRCWGSILEGLVCQ